MATSLGYQTLSVMVAEVGTLVHDTSTARQTPIKQIINRAYDTIAARFDWPQFLVVDESGVRSNADSTIKTFESGQAEAPLAFSLDAVAEIWFQYQDSTRDPIPLVHASELYRRAGSGLNTTGRPRFAALVGVTAQTARLSADGFLTAKSDVTTNNNALSPRIMYMTSAEGFREPVTESLSGAFSTGVTLSQQSLAGYTVRQVVLPTGWKGDFTLEDGSSNVVLKIHSMVQPTSVASAPARIISNSLLRLWPVPDIDYAMTITYRRRPRPLVNDDDAPEIPVSTYLVEKAAAEILRQQNKPDLGRQHEFEAADFMRATIRRHHARPVAPRPARGSFVGMADME